MVWVRLLDNLLGVKPTPLNIVCSDLYTLSLPLPGLQLVTAPLVLVKLLYSIPSLLIL